MAFESHSCCCREHSCSVLGLSVYPQYIFSCRYQLEKSIATTTTTSSGAFFFLLWRFDAVSIAALLYLVVEYVKHFLFSRSVRALYLLVEYFTNLFSHTAKSQFGLAAIGSGRSDLLTLLVVFVLKNAWSRLR